MLLKKDELKRVLKEHNIKAGVPGLNSMLEELKQRFPGKRSKADIKTVENV